MGYGWDLGGPKDKGLDTVNIYKVALGPEHTPDSIQVQISNLPDLWENLNKLLKGKLFILWICFWMTSKRREGSPLFLFPWDIATVSVDSSTSELTVNREVSVVGISDQTGTLH